MSRLVEEGSLSSQPPLPLFPKPQPSQCPPALPVSPSPFLSSHSGVQQGRPHLGEDWEGCFSSLHSYSTRLPPLPTLSPNPSRAAAPTLLRPHRAQKLWRGLAGWGMQDWRRREGSCPQAALSRRAREAERDSCGDRLPEEALVLLSVSKKQTGACGSDGGGGERGPSN